MKYISTFLSFIFAMATAGCTGGPEISDYNVIWDTPSADAAGCMPIGNGMTGVNCWVEESGDIVFYLSRNDAWDETGELCKLGRIRLSFEPSILTDASSFSQTLDLENGCIRFKGSGMNFRLLVDSESQTVFVTGRSEGKVRVKASAEVWRTSDHTITAAEAPYTRRSVSEFPEGVTFRTSADHVGDGADAVTVCHYNQESSYDETIALQGIKLDNAEKYDPFLHRCFGFRMTGKGMKKTSDLSLETEGGVRDMEIAVCTDCGITPDMDKWTENLAGRAAVSAGKAEKRTSGWWREFWDRSHIFVTTPDVTTGMEVTRAYILQSWVNACGGRGDYAIKYNGSIFTVDPGLTDPKYDFGPDMRKWGGDFWWQNTRLMYHPMLMAGHFDLMMPLFEHYARNLEMFKADARCLWNTEGAFVPETTTLFGTYCCKDFRWNRTGLRDGEVGNPYIRYIWNPSLELLSLMLDYYDYTGDKGFVKEKVLPMAREFLTFFDSFFEKDTCGRILITPTQSIETYWYDVVGDMPDVAGLHEVLPRLMALDIDGIPDVDRDFWKRLYAAVPGLPLREVGGVTLFAPAVSYNPKRCNVENPELYTIFPFHLCNLSTDNLQLGIDSFNARVEHKRIGWQQNGQQAARLGLTDEARECLLEKVHNCHGKFRFPVMWKPNYDWLPDQNHGGNLMLTLQEMVMQNYGDKTYLLPAFPDDWDVDFKLCTPGGGTVEGSRTGGALKWKKSDEGREIVLR